MFGSDNHSGVHPDIMKAMISANNDFTIAYGEDDYRRRQDDPCDSYQLHGDYICGDQGRDEEGRYH